MNYQIVIEETETGFSAFVPELPGCIAAGDSYDEVMRLLDEAVAFHRDEDRAGDVTEQESFFRVAMRATTYAACSSVGTGSTIVAISENNEPFKTSLRSVSIDSAQLVSPLHELKVLTSVER